MARLVEIGHRGDIQKLDIGDRFDLLNEDGSTSGSAGTVKEIVPPYSEKQPESERTVRADFRGTERLIPGNTKIINWGPQPARRITIAEESQAAEFPTSTTPIFPSGMFRSPIIPDVSFNSAEHPKNLR